MKAIHNIQMASSASANIANSLENELYLCNGAKIILK